MTNAPFPLSPASEESANVDPPSTPQPSTDLSPNVQQEATPVLLHPTHHIHQYRYLLPLPILHLNPTALPPTPIHPSTFHPPNPKYGPSHPGHPSHYPKPLRLNISIIAKGGLKYLRSVAPPGAFRPSPSISIDSALYTPLPVSPPTPESTDESTTTDSISTPAAAAPAAPTAAEIERGLNYPAPAGTTWLSDYRAWTIPFSPSTSPHPGMHASSLGMMERVRAGDWLAESDTGVRVSVERNGGFRSVGNAGEKWENLGGASGNELVRSGEAAGLSMKVLRRMEHESGISTKRNQILSMERRGKKRRAALAGEKAVARPFRCHCNRVFER